MSVKKHRLVGLKGTEHASRGMISGDLYGEAFLPGDGPCNGYGDEVGDAGGYGEEETGYGSPCGVEGWYVVAVLEESLAASEASGVSLSGVGSNAVREDGGELVVVSSTGPLGVGPYQVSIRPSGGSSTRPAYSGVLGQGNVVEVDLDNNWFSFVAPFSIELGAADVIIDRPGGQVIAAALINYVPHSDRSGTKMLRSFYPDVWDKGSYEPTVEG